VLVLFTWWEILGSFGVVLDGSLSGNVLFFVKPLLFACFLVQPMVFVATLWIVSSSFLHFSSELSG
jgi:hypothetical protein